MEVVIAIALVYIAWQQCKINRDKLRLALYDRRLKVYESLMELFVTIFQSGKVSDEMWSKYRIGTAEATFLFDSEISDFKRTVDGKACELLFANNTLKNLPKGEERNTKAKEISELLKWFTEKVVVIQSKFERHLRFEEQLDLITRLHYLMSPVLRRFWSFIKKLAKKSWRKKAGEK